MKYQPFTERFGVPDTCVIFECCYAYEEFAAIRERGYTGVIFGYLEPTGAETSAVRNV